MKKLLLAICLGLCIFILLGCSNNTPATPTEAPTATPTEAPTATPTEEPTLESKVWESYSYSRDMYIENGKKAAEAMVKFAKKNFKSPRSLRLEAAYFATNWFVFNVSGENSYGGRQNSYYVYDFDDQKLSNLDDMFVDSYIKLSTEATGNEFDWLASMIDQ